MKVSSRAPVWGASEQPLRSPSRGKVSSRAPVWGASFGVRKIEQIHTGFKSCPRVGGISGGTGDGGERQSFKSCPRVGGILLVWLYCDRNGGVSSRAPVWGASLDPGQIGELRLSFKSCPRVGGIASCASSFWLVMMFQVVPPCGGHPERQGADAERHQVSSRAPVWGASWTPSSSCPRASFKSCPRVGGIQIISTVLPVLAVSSRAPVWGASTKGASFLLPSRVSSRAPVWGASQTTASRSSPPLFQVVPPCGGHRQQVIAVGVAFLVSSRAPVWGASGLTLETYGITDQFQVVPPCGGHQAGALPVVSAVKFQVVPPCGGHPDLVAQYVGLMIVSSRAPVWGASRACAGRPCGLCSFKSCPRVGGLTSGATCERPNRV